MKTIKNNNNQVYISDVTRSLIDRGLTSSDQLIQPDEVGFKVIMEPVFHLTSEKLQEGKRLSANYPLSFKEEVILDLGVKGGSYFQVLDDLLFINDLNALFDLSGNLVKKIEALPTYSYSLVDKNNNQLFIINDNQVYALDEQLEIIFKSEKITHNKNVLTLSNGLPALFTSESLFIGWGQSWGTCYIVKYDRQNGKTQKLKLEKGFCLVAANPVTGRLITYHKSKGLYREYDITFKLSGEYSGEKENTNHTISTDGNYLIATSSGKSFLTAYHLPAANSFKIDVHPANDKNYKIKKKDLGIKTRVITFLDESNRLFISGDKFRTIVYSFDDSSYHILKGHDNTFQDMFFSGVNGFSLSADHRYLLTSGTDCTTIIWDKDYNIQGQLKGHNLAVNHAEFLSEKEKIVTTSVDGTIRIWNADKQ
jgi:hypothetical protein